VRNDHRPPSSLLQYSPNLSPRHLLPRPEDFSGLLEPGIYAEPQKGAREVLRQAFNWESNQQNWWQNLLPQARRFADMGFTIVWLPPPTTSVAPQGYMPLDYYNLNSAYGSEEDLRKYTPPLHHHHTAYSPRNWLIRFSQR
jgi:hypothetical protein